MKDLETIKLLLKDSCGDELQFDLSMFQIQVGDVETCAAELVKNMLIKSDLHPKYDVNGYARDDIEF